MSIPVTPQLNLNLNEDDHSSVDESFKPAAPINVQGDFNQNCGNVKEMSRRRSMWTTIIISVICDIGLGWFLFTGQENLERRFDTIKQAKEGTIWILRDDLIKSMEFYEATKVITAKQFRRIKDEYDYYTSIGGNHDVKERFDDFTTKVYGTQEIKMMSSAAPPKKLAQP